MKQTVLVTGGCGYIGSHIVYDLLDHDYDVVVVDNLSNSRRDILPMDVTFYQADIHDTERLYDILRMHAIKIVIHMAAFISVEESVRNPLTYYHNNVEGTRSLLAACLKNNITKILFSSTGAVYQSSEKPLKEHDPQIPSSPYGHSKLMAEQLIADTVAASDINAVILRYFNVAGAERAGRTGQQGLSATHLIARTVQVAAGDLDVLTVMGNDYPTQDGTCIRDYIHVSDLATAHRTVLEQNFPERLKIFNCGYGKGYSVKDVIDHAKKIIRADLNVRIAERRPGDAIQVVADNSALLNETLWRPEHDDLETIIDTAWKWYQRERLVSVPNT